MEFIVWFIGIVAVSGGIVAFLKSAWFQNKLLVQPKAAPVKPKTLREVHEEDHKFWLGEYKAILQKDCDHLYHHQNWYTCKMCGYEEPWEYRDGCRCTVAEDRSLTDINPTYHLIKRQFFCIVHGTDFKMFPVSDRKRGPYGPQSDSNGAVERSRELTRGRSMRRIDYDIEGRH
jgi:hypothetical protein